MLVEIQHGNGKNNALICSKKLKKTSKKLSSDIVSSFVKKKSIPKFVCSKNKNETWMVSTFNLKNC